MSVALWTIRLPAMTRAPWLSCGARVRVLLVDRRAGLLELQEERVATGAALEQREVHHHPDAADPDHLAHDVDGDEAVEEVPAIILERQPVVGDQVVDDVALFVVVERHAQRRLGDDARPSAPLRGQLGERPAARPFLLALLELDLHLAPVGGFEVVDEAVEARAVVPDVEEAAWRSAASGADRPRPPP